MWLDQLMICACVHLNGWTKEDTTFNFDKLSLLQEVNWAEVTVAAYSTSEVTAVS